jgi:hypothetical protein
MKHIKTFENFSNKDTANEAKLQGAEWDLWVDVEDMIMSLKNKYKGKVKPGKIKEFVEDYISDLKESKTNEGNDLSYWAQYAEDKSPQANMNPWMSDECKTMPEVLKCIDKSIAAWNKESEDGPISKADEKWVGNLAVEYWKKFKTINGNIISAMIMQESK